MITRCVARGKIFIWALGGCLSSKSQSGQKMAYGSQFLLVTRRVTWPQWVDLLCVGWGSLEEHLQWWEFLEECPGVGNSDTTCSTALRKLLSSSLSCTACSHTSCLEVEASVLVLFPSIFHVQTGKYFMGCWHSGFTGSTNVFQEVVKFKACMFLLSLLLPSICFQLFWLCGSWIYFFFSR